MQMAVRGRGCDKAATYREERDAFRKKNVGDYFVDTSKVVRQWLQALACEVKEKGEYGIHPLMTADYYQQAKDRELALMASLFVSDNGNVLMQVEHLREILTDSPSEWYRERGFVRLGIGKLQSGRLNGGGCRLWMLSRLFARIWDIEHPKGGGVSDLETELLHTSRMMRVPLLDAMTFHFSDLCISMPFWKLNMLLIRLVRRDGLGMGLWGSGDEELFCPWNHDVKVFLMTWFPDYRQYGPIRQCVKLFGLNDDVDFFYAFLGYKELQRRNPAGCSRLATCYRRWYDNGIRKKPFKWRELLPEIVI